MTFSALSRSGHKKILSFFIIPHFQAFAEAASSG
jgi:hypothetical protein